MKKISLILVFITLTNFLNAQDINTIIKRDTSKPFIFGFYGEVLGGATQLNKDMGAQFGIKGAMVMNRKFGFGPIAKVNAGLSQFRGNNLNFNENAVLELYMVSAGLFVEYIVKMENKVHFTVPLNIMVGGVSIQEDDPFQDPTFSKKSEREKTEVESSGVFIIEPGMNVDFNISKFFVPSIKLGYRAAMGSTLINVSDQNLSGAYFGLGLKLGKF